MAAVAGRQSRRAAAHSPRSQPISPASCVSQSLPRPGPVVSARPCSARRAPRASARRGAARRPGSDQALGALAARRGEIAIASRRLALPSSTSPSRMSERPIALSASARGPASAPLAAARAPRGAAGSTSLKRPCSIAILAWREKMRARSGLWASSSGSSSTRARDRVARVLGAAERPLRARQQLEQPGRAAAAAPASSTSPSACSQQRLGARVGAVVDQRARGAAHQLDAVAAGLLLASGTRDHSSSARSSSAPASPWAWTRSAASAARTDAHERLALAAGRQVVVGDAGA